MTPPPRRQQILLAILGVIAALFAGDWLLQNVLEGPLQERREQTASLQQKIEQREAEFQKARQAAQELAAWEKRSLPSNVEAARSLYQAWLLELVVTRVGLTNPNVDSGEPMPRRDMWQSLSFSVRAEATLEQLMTFLFHFYRAGHLHQIKSLSITPLAKGGMLDVALAIEALVLPGADRTDRLTDLQSDQLASPTLQDYQVIVQRNLFATGGGHDATEQAFLTAVTNVDGDPTAWFTMRLTDRVLKLHRGDKLEIGPFTGVVVDISDSEVIVESDGERWLISLGDNLAQAYAVPPEF